MESRANQGDLCSQPGSGTERDCHADHQREIFMEATSPAKAPQETVETRNCHKQGAPALSHPVKHKAGPEKRETWKWRPMTGPQPQAGAVALPTLDDLETTGQPRAGSSTV